MDPKPIQKRGPKKPSKASKKRIEALKLRWLDEFTRTGWRGATSAIGVSANTVYYWYSHDPIWRAMYDKVHTGTIAELECILDDAARGLRDMSGPQVTAAIFRLKGLAPARYRERYSLEHTGADGGPVKIESGDSSRGMRMLETWRDRCTSVN
jgi:hypothetical protein